MLSAVGEPAGPLPARLPAATNVERMLLVEPDIVARRTVAAVIHELGIGRVEEAADAHGAVRLLQDTRYAALLIELGDDPSFALDLIGRVRDGLTACAARMPVVAMSRVADARTLQRLKLLGARLLVRPFKVRTVLEIVRAFEFCAA